MQIYISGYIYNMYENSNFPKRSSIQLNNITKNGK